MPIVRCLIISAFFSLAGFAFAQTDSGTFSHAGIKAKPINRKAPAYPRAELNRRQQGWVDLSYVVTPEGQVVDPVVENSSGSTHFEKAALRTVRFWTFEPATWDGRPVQQCDTRVRITFALGKSNTGVSRPFHKKYKKIDKLLLAGETDEAAKRIDDAFETHNLTLTEISWLWAIKSRLSGLLGDENAQLVALRRATTNGRNWVDKKLYPNLLLAKSVRELERGRMSDAFETFEKLEETGANVKHLDTVRSEIEKLREIVAGPALLVTRALIEPESDCADCESDWQYTPLRRRFHLANIDGDLDHVEVRCDWTRLMDPARTGDSWELPAEWGNCKVFIFGQPGTTFDFMEEPST